MKKNKINETEAEMNLPEAEDVLENVVEEPAAELPLVEEEAPAESAEPEQPAVVEEEPSLVVEEPAPTYEEPTPEEEEAEEEPEAPAPQPKKKGTKPPKRAPAPQPAMPTKTYTGLEKKLRRKYKMDKDDLLSSNDVVPGFILAQGEKVVRNYHCLAASKGLGTICLTNRRLLVNADERAEVSIEQLSGIKFSRFAKFSFARFFFALLFTAIAAFCVLLPIIEWKVAIPNISGEARKLWAEILCYVGGGISFFIALPNWFKLVRKTFYFYIFAHQDSPFIACKNAGYSKREAKGKVASYMVASAGKESEKAARELGAFIIEVKEGRFDK